MKLPVESLPPAEPADDLYAIRRRQPVPAPSRVAPRTLPPLIIPAPHAHVPEEEEVDREAGIPVTWQPGERREGEDRRRLCRRITHVPALLDTRSGEDRRHRARREDDPIIGVDKEV
jgi:hypothetical protein